MRCLYKSRRTNNGTTISTTENLVYGMLQKNDSSRTTEDIDNRYKPATEFHNQETTKSDNSDIYMNIGSFTSEWLLPLVIRYTCRTQN